MLILAYETGFTIWGINPLDFLKIFLIFVLSETEFKQIGISPNMLYLNMLYSIMFYLNKRNRENTIECTDFL